MVYLCDTRAAILKAAHFIFWTVQIVLFMHITMLTFTWHESMQKCNVPKSCDSGSLGGAPGNRSPADSQNVFIRKPQVIMIIICGSIRGPIRLAVSLFMCRN